MKVSKIYVCSDYLFSYYEIIKVQQIFQESFLLD